MPVRFLGYEIRSPITRVDLEVAEADSRDQSRTLLPTKVRECLRRHQDLVNILESLATGMLYKEVQSELRLGKGTVKGNVKALCIACGRTPSRETALQLAERYGLIPPRTFR